MLSKENPYQLGYGAGKMGEHCEYVIEDNWAYFLPIAGRREGIGKDGDQHFKFAEQYILGYEKGKHL